MSSSMREKGWEAGNGPSEPASPLEWWVAGFSLLLVLGTVGVLVQDGLRASSTPPQIRLEIDSILPAGQGYVVEFSAHNDGQTTAAGLTVEGTIESAAGGTETSEVTIDYVPAGGARGGGLFFTEDPRRRHLKIRPKGYDRP